jgi:hypothetical protein
MEAWRRSNPDVVPAVGRNKATKNLARHAVPFEKARRSLGILWQPRFRTPTIPLRNSGS